MRILFGENLIWRFFYDSPNRQIKVLAKFSGYTVLKYEDCWLGFGLLSERERFSLIMNNKSIILCFAAKFIYRMFKFGKALL